MLVGIAPADELAEEAAGAELAEDAPAAEDAALEDDGGFSEGCLPVGICWDLGCN